MDGILVLLYGIGGFVVLCCACSFWQAYRVQVTEVHFDNLHSKYSRENIERVKDKRRKTAQEILELKEEIRIAEERLLAEHQYEQKLRNRVQQKELRPNLKRRNINKSKSWPVRRRTKAPRLVLEDSSSEDMEDLLASKENYEHDIEKGRNHSQHIRKRNFTNKRKDDNIIEKVYQWFNEPSPRRRMRSSSGSSEKAVKRLSIKLPKFDWAPFKKQKVNPIHKYSTNQQIIEKEPAYYQPKLQTEVREITLESKPKVSSPDLKLAVKSPPEKYSKPTRMRVSGIQLSKSAKAMPAWESPISAESDSVGMAFQSPVSKIPMQKGATPRIQKRKLQINQSDFSSKNSMDADQGLYGSEVDDVFNPEHELEFDGYSDL